MQELHQLLQQSKQLAITAATGMGGIGKTDLAWHYAEAHRDDYPGGIWWISAAQLVVKVLAYSEEMRLSIPPEDFDAADKVQWCYREWLSAIPEGARLLVWDDVGDAEAYGELRPYLPTDARFRLLITTRAKLGHPVQRLELDVLDQAAALELLGQLVGSEARLVAAPETARTLCEWVGRLPLGIELVGRHLARHPNLTLSTLLSRLEAQKLSARAFQQVAPEMPYRDSLAAAFEISWQGLSEAAQQLGGLLSLFGLAPISKALIVNCLPEWDEEDLEDALDLALVGSSLLSALETGEYLLHSLIREFFAAKLQAFSTAAALQHGFAQAMTKVAKTIPQTVTLSDLARTKNTMPHIEAAAFYSALLSNEDCLWPRTSLARLYAGQSLWQQAERWYGDCLKMTEARFGKQHPDTATSLNNLAGLYDSQGRYGEAEPLYLDALNIRRSQLGAEHPDTASSLNNLAGLYDSQGRYGEAEPLYLDALNIRRSQLGTEHPDTATSLNNLAGLYDSQGRYGEAEPLYLDALNIRRSQLGAEHPSTATSLNNLALLYKSQGRYGEAEPLYLDALNIRRSQLGAEHPDTASSLNNLAALYESQGRYSEAEPLYLQTLAIFLEKLGENHPNTQTVWGNFRDLLQQAVEAGRAAELSDHPATQAVLKELTNG
ncbi:MAG: tetratricopeptide repeat protein [Pegethrix bostrychoides GSE-TBD4-15B]|jgi:Flp pilus assembly protein TadD|uniref:Tetratricopeptide repeat protein n=1 Tax=Pegethrix bostrychoides GSE-TBD4-15B TaxID=2839662 RepID=A0A951U709_9CYAN|nr:tetratricopeptide repeat protein [Pegethrix bostrychoides GSE-TBD4-15B]